MNETYSKADLRDIAEELVEDLRELDDGTTITTWQLLQTSGYDEEEMAEMNLMYLHDVLVKAAKRNHIVFDIPANEGDDEGLPYNSHYIVHNKKAQIKCPHCGSNNTARIIYGYPLYSEKLKKNLDSGKWILGGCMVDICEIDGDCIYTNPERACNECKRRFAAAPILTDTEKGVNEDYRDIVTCICFELDSIHSAGTGQRIDIKRNDEGAVVTVRHPLTSHESFEHPVECRQITENRWYKILNKLYCDMYLHEWKKEYDQREQDDITLDGYCWKLDITMTGGLKESYCGSNAYPPYWDELLKIFRSFEKIATCARPRS